MSLQHRRAARGGGSALSSARLMAVKFSANPGHLEWVSLARSIQESEGLPDLSDSGLRKIFKEFDVVSRKMDKVYERYGSDPRTTVLQGGVLALWALMCKDAMLRDKFVAAGLLDKVIPLLDDNKFRELALECIRSVVTHEGDAYRLRIAKYIPKVAGYLRDYHTERYCLFGTIIMSRCLSAFAHEPSAKHQELQASAKLELLSSIDSPALLDLLMDVFARTMWTWPETNSPKSHHTIITNIAHILSLAPVYIHPLTVFYENSRVVDFLICGLQCDGWIIQGLCFSGFVKLQRGISHYGEDDLDDNSSSNETPFECITQKLSQLKNDIPESLASLIDPEDVDDLEVAVACRDTEAYLNAISDAIETGDIYNIGLILARSIENADFVLLSSRLEPLEPTDAHSFLSGFASTSDVLEACIKAIRGAEDKDTLYLADILEIYRHYTFKGADLKGSKMALRALKNNPDRGFFYYFVVSRCPDLSDDDSLELMEAALHSIPTVSDVPPKLRLRLLEQAVLTNARIGFHSLTQDFEWNSRGPHLEYGVRALVGAVLYAREYVEEAPLGKRGVADVAAWYVLLSVVVDTGLERGRKFDIEAEDIQDALQKIYISEAIAEHTAILKSAQQSKSEIRHALDLFMSRHDEATKNFGPLFRKMEETLKEATKKKKYQHENGCARGCKHHHDDNDDGSEDGGEVGRRSVGMKTQLVDTLLKTTDRKAPWNDPNRGPTLDVCVECGNASRALKKCGGCGKVKFCGKECQKAAWKWHKTDCAHRKAQAERKVIADDDDDDE